MRAEDASLFLRKNVSTEYNALYDVDVLPGRTDIRSHRQLARTHQ